MAHRGSLNRKRVGEVVPIGAEEAGNLARAIAEVLKRHRCTRATEVEINRWRYGCECGWTGWELEVHHGDVLAGYAAIKVRLQDGMGSAREQLDLDGVASRA